MMMIRIQALVPSICVLCCASGLLLGKAYSSPASYAIQSSSWIRVVESTFDADSNVISGTKILNTIGIREQSPGSLQSQISGTLSADVTGSTVVFGNSQIQALPHPDRPFLPQIPESPGEVENFGAITLNSFNGGELPNGYASVLDAVTQLTGGAAILGSAPTSVSFSLTYGVLNYDIFGTIGYDFLGPSEPVLNQTTGTFSGDVDGTIHLPFYIEFPYPIADPMGPDDSAMVFEGEIVATRISTTLSGDYNRDSKVNAADFVVWRKLDGTSATLADGSGNGSVGPEDYGIWRDNFGSEIAVGAQRSEYAVPEPACLGCMIICLAGTAMRRSRLRS